MERFNEEKKQLSGMLKLLIKLYYLMKGKKGLTTDAVSTLEDFVRSVTGRSFSYDSHTGKLVGRYEITIKETEIESFLQIMSILEKAEETVHFILLGINDSVDTSFMFFETHQWSEEKDVPGNDKKIIDPEIHWGSIDDINQNINSAIKNQSSSKIGYEKVDVVSSPERFYTVTPVSEFAIKLIKAQPREDPPCQIFPIKMLSVAPDSGTHNTPTPIKKEENEERLDQTMFAEMIKKNINQKNTISATATSLSIEPQPDRNHTNHMSALEPKKIEANDGNSVEVPPKMKVKAFQLDEPRNSMPVKSLIIKPIVGQSEKTSQKYDDRWKSFIQIARSVLINFHLSFGSYERIKKCIECGKLLFEKKKASGLYCSVKCKTDYNNKLVGPDKRRCKERQNIWIRRMSQNRNIRSDKIRYHTVYKERCKGCTINPKPKGGECPVLKKNNDTLFDKLANIA